MTNKVNQPGSGEPTVAVRELVEDELDLVVGGEQKETEKKKEVKKPDPSEYLQIKLTPILITS